MGDLQSIDTSLAEHKYSTGKAPATVNVTTSSGELVASNSSREYAAIVNDSDTDIYLALGQTAVANRGIRINSGGGSYEINWQNLFTGAINGIHGGSGNKAVTIQECPA